MPAKNPAMVQSPEPVVPDTLTLKQGAYSRAPVSSYIHSGMALPPCRSCSIESVTRTSNPSSPSLTATIPAPLEIQESSNSKISAGSRSLGLVTSSKNSGRNIYSSSSIEGKKRSTLGRTLFRILAQGVLPADDSGSGRAISRDVVTPASPARAMIRSNSRPLSANILNFRGG